MQLGRLGRLRSAREIEVFRSRLQKFTKVFKVAEMIGRSRRMADGGGSAGGGGFCSVHALALKTIKSVENCGERN